MKKMKKADKFLLIILIFAILGFTFGNYFALRTQASYGGAGDLSGFAQLSWDQVKDLSFQSGATLGAKNGDTEDYLSGYKRLMCYHSNQAGHGGGEYLILNSIVDIDENGNVYITNSGGKKQIGTAVPGAKELAAYGAKISGFHKGTSPSNSVWNTYRSDFWAMMKKGMIGILQSNGVPSFDNGTGSNGGGATSEAQYAATYEAGTNTDGKTYVGRIFMFISQDGSEGVQDRAILFGGEGGSLKIDKYITKYEGSKSQDIGDARANQTDTAKQAYPIEVPDKDTEVTYKIKIKNTGSKKVKAKYTDTYEAPLTEVDGTFEETFEIGPGETKEYSIVLTFSQAVTGKFKNTATVVIIRDDGSEGSKSESSDWVKLEDKSAPTIKKYITAISGDGAESPGDRSNMSEAAKEGSPVNGGNISKSDVTVNYTVAITNNSSKSLKGTYTDEPESGLSKSSSGEGEIEIPAETTVKYTVTVTLAKDSFPKVYKNTAYFEYKENAKDTETTKIFSSDWFKVEEKEEKPTPLASITKYITNVEGGDNEWQGVASDIPTGSREDMSNDEKTNSPVEVSKDTTVTYTIDLTCNNIDYMNKAVNNTDCESDPKNPDEEEHQKLAPQNKDYGNYCTFDLTFEDTWQEGLEFVSASSVEGGDVSYTISGNTAKIKLDNCKSERLDTPETAEDGTKITAKWSGKVEVRLKVTASDMTLPNIENKATGVDWHYTKYNCWWEQVYEWDKVSESTKKKKIPKSGVPDDTSSQSGDTITAKSYSVIDDTYMYETTEQWKYIHHHKDGDCKDIESKHGDICHWEHDSEEYKGTIKVDEDKNCDYVRLLDPVVEGNVWDDIQRNGLRDGGESLDSIIRDDYKNIAVKLWKSDGTFIANKIVDGSGNYTFGRVRKGNDKVGDGEDKWYDIGNGNEFYYSSSSLTTYYITFEYNGERYQAVPEYVDIAQREDAPEYKRDSNAEEQNRQEFNNTFETISNNRAWAGNTPGASSKPLQYETQTGASGLQESKLVWSGDGIEDQTNTSWSSNYTSTAGINRSPTMIAKTNNFYFSDGNIDYLKHIDMGIYQRENDPTLSTSKDVVKAEVTVNNHQTIYNYFANGQGDYGSTHNVQNIPYSLSIYREDYEYRTTNYASEIQTLLNNQNRYTSYGRDNDLHIILTYRITVKNDSTNHNAVVREVVDYYSTELTPLIAKYSDHTDDAIEDVESLVDLSVNPGSNWINPGQSSSICAQEFISGTAMDGKTLRPGEAFDIYLTYRVNKNENNYIITEDGSEGTEDSKMNISEIGTYSIYNIDGSVAGLVDQNSNPGNVEFSGDKPDTSKFEDDTFETGIIVVLKDLVPPGTPPETPPGTVPQGDKYDYRNISGIVYEEIVQNSNSETDGQKVSDGEMILTSDPNTSDRPAANVIVKLYEVIQKLDSNGKPVLNSNGAVEEEYYVDTGLWYRTGDDGMYYFGNATESFGGLEGKEPINSPKENESTDDCYKLHSGHYVVRFIYGDEAENLKTEDGNLIRYSGQDYKSVKYTDPGANPDDVNTEVEVVRAIDFAKKSGDTRGSTSKDASTNGKIYSYAKDNEIRRLEVNDYSTTTTNLMDTVLKAKQDSEEMKILADRTSMFADTKVFDMDIEYYDDTHYDVSLDKFVKDGKERDITKYYYSVKDINFGLVERPRAKLQLMNDISEIRAITSDGNTLMDVFFNIQYEWDSAKEEIIHKTTRDDTRSTGSQEVQILNRNDNNQGFRYANIDTDVLQGMVITVKYRIAVANISDVDHLSAELENNLEEQLSTELDVTYNKDEGTTNGTENGNYSVLTDDVNNNKGVTEDPSNPIKHHTREYTYNYSNLWKLLYGSNGDITQADPGTEYTYGGIPSSELKGSKAVRKNYSYSNIKNRANSGYRIGYYLGNIYYNNKLSSEIPEMKVKTRPDQFIDYVDNDLIFKPEENLNDNSQIKYLTYTTQEIAKKGLLKDIYWVDGTDTSLQIRSITDGEKDYYNMDSANTNNNLAFNIESHDINPEFYLFKEPISKDATIPNYSADDNSSSNLLYTIDLQASRTLSSELDLDGVIIDNIAEIVKATNTMGRKIYVKDESNAEEQLTGFLGNTTKTPIESVNTPGSTTSLVDISKPETDTDFTEFVTFSPPTGLYGDDAVAKTVSDKVGNVLLIGIPVVVIIAGTSYVIVQFVKRKKFYK